MSERQRRVDALFDQAQRLPPESRVAWLESACDGDALLLGEIRARFDETARLAAVPELAPGVSVSHYRLMNRLGAGGMGEVWLATDEKLGRKVALKFPTATLVSDPTSRHRLLREARAAAALDHAAVCRVFELGEADGRDFIAMEVIPGETLAAVLARGPLAVPQALEWGACLAAALDEAHRKGLVHRDLKPGNVMVTPAGQVKVMDFGLARPLAGQGDGDAQDSTWTAGLTTPGTLVGTPTYMAPELLHGEQAGEKSDIWALGCILFEMLTGARAFSGSGVTAIMAAILERDPDFARLPAQTPDEVKSLIRRMLQKDPARRVRDAGDVRLVIEETRETLRLNGRRDTQPGSGPVDEAGRVVPAVPPGFSRRRLMLGAGAAGLLGAGFGSGAVLLSGREQGRVPAYHRLTFRRGLIRSARFAPDQQTILYGALWDGDSCRTSIVRPESPESRSLDLPPSTPVAISATGEIAVILGGQRRGLWPRGTLARVPLAGGAPRELLENVSFADWSPDGKELAVVKVGEEKDTLEFPAGNVIFESQGGLSFPRVSPDGSKVAVFHHTAGFGGFVVIADRSGVTKYRSPEFRELYGLAWRGEEVWFTGGNERRTFRAIHAIRPPDPPRLVMRTPANVTLHDVATDGRLLIAHTNDRSGIAVLRPGSTTENNLSWLDGSLLADLAPDGSLALFSEIAQGGGANNAIYVRPTDGSPAVHLGEGRALALSPDRRWVAAVPQLPSPSLEILPTGAGESRRLALPGASFRDARWLPDGQRLVVMVDQEGAGRALLILHLAERRAPQAITPKDRHPRSWAVAPDGGAVAVTHAAAEPRIYPFDGGEPRPLRGLKESESLWSWLDEGVLVSEANSIETVFLVDPVSGERRLWRELAPGDPAGIMNLGNLVVTPDGRSYAYWWHRALSDLYLLSDVV